MSRDPSSDPPARLTVSPLLQLLIGLAAVAFLLNQLTALTGRSPAQGDGVFGRKRGQVVYVLSPKQGSVEELHGLLGQGWRITHVSNAASPGDSVPVTRFGFLMENPSTREQDYLFFTTGESAGAGLKQVADLQQKGFRIVNVGMTSVPGGGWNSHTTFVLEK